MNLKKMLIADVLIAFLVFTGYIVYKYGLVQALEMSFANGVTMLLVTDLLIALTLTNIWMWRSARARGINPIPYVIATVLTGSAGPLLFLTIHGFSDRKKTKAVSGVGSPVNAV